MPTHTVAAGTRGWRRRRAVDGAGETMHRVGVGFALVAVASACEPIHPGESVGTYTIVATLDRHGCGVTAVPVRQRLRYRVEIRSDRGIGYWHRPGQPVVSGLCDGRSFSFSTSVLVPVLPPESETGYVGCTLEQRQTIEGTLVPLVGPQSSAPDAAFGDGGPAQRDAATHGAEADAGFAMDGSVAADARADGALPDAATAPRVLEGTDEIVFAPAPGSDCTPLLTAAGGPWATLPCTVRYRVEGTDVRAP
jgi:hypothetical protein